MTSSAIGSALSGLNATMKWFNATAATIAHANMPDSPPDDDLVSSIVQSKMAASAVKVDAAVLRTTMETEKSLIDVFA